jgi:hypothetical protein
MLVKAKLILGAVFFCMCFGLGYAPLSRYDPASVTGLSDSGSYVSMVVSDSGVMPKRSFRVLVPLLARPIARAVTGRIGNWNPVLFGLLVVNSIFVAWAAILLMTIGEAVTADRRTGLVAALIYLLTFNVTNFQLVGLVDSVEAWALLAIAWALLTRQWLFVPLIGFIGELGKETSVPLLVVFCFAWIAFLAITRDEKRPPYWTFAALVAAQMVAVEVVHVGVTGHLVPPWHLSSPTEALIMTRQPFPGMAMLREMIYSFVWLLPLGIPRLRDMPRVWIISTAASLLAVVALTLWMSVGENATRPTFNVASPILALSAAIFLGRILGPAKAIER